MSPDADQIAFGRLRVSRQAALAGLATAVFIALSIWWLLYDKRVPGGGDPGRHLSLVQTFAGWLADGDVGNFFDPGAQYGEDFFYPPLVYFVGAIPSALGLATEDWSMIAVNLAFVPMLTAGCFLVGRMTYGPTAGLLAVIFALATPMVLSLFHVFMLDAPLAGSVAITLWALLASDRFSRRRETVLAGALLGLATMTKTPAPLFLAGPVAVMLIGGGWRQWRNLLIGAGAALIVAGPYYLINLDSLIGTSETTTIAGNTGATGGASLAAEPRFSFDNFAYYGWVGVNLQYFVPLLALLAVGLVSALREIRRRPYLPELVAGLVVGYLAPTLILSVRDPRYTLPLVVFVAVLATGWIAVSRGAVLAGIGAAVLAGAVVLNVGPAVIDDVPTAQVSAPGDSPADIIQPGRFTFVDGRGYVVGPPRPNPLWDRLLSAAEREGVETARILPRETPLWGTDVIGFDVLAFEYGIRGRSALEGTVPDPDLRINTWWTSDEHFVDVVGLPEPCGHVEEGSVPPPGREPVQLAVAVERRVGDHYERWCDF